MPFLPLPGVWCWPAWRWRRFFSPWWLLLTAFAGLNMIQAAFTGFCPAAMLFRRLGVRPGEAFR